MSNENLVYAYEANFITALETILDVALTQTVAFGDATVHKTPRIEVGFTYGGTNPTDRGLTLDGAQFLRKHNGTISLKVNGTVQSDHLALVGQVRNFMAWNMPTLINPALAYYQVQSVFEQGGSNESGEENGDFEIVTEMNFDIVFQIPPAAFNANFASTDGISDKAIVADCSALGSGVYKVTGRIRSATAGAKVLTLTDGLTAGSKSVTVSAENVWEDFETSTASLSMGILSLGYITPSDTYSAADWADVRLIDTSDNSVVGYWLCNEKDSGSLDGVTAVDSSGNGFDGVYVGCTGGVTSEL